MNTRKISNQHKLIVYIIDIWCVLIKSGKDLFAFAIWYRFFPLLLLEYFIRRLTMTGVIKRCHRLSFTVFHRSWWALCSTTDNIRYFTLNAIESFYFSISWNPLYQPYFVLFRMQSEDRRDLENHAYENVQCQLGVQAPLFVIIKFSFV